MSNRGTLRQTKRPFFVPERNLEAPITPTTNQTGTMNATMKQSMLEVMKNLRISMKDRGYTKEEARPYHRAVLMEWMPDNAPTYNLTYQDFLEIINDK